MSKESIMSIIDQALLRGLNPDYQDEGQEPIACVWIEVSKPEQDAMFLESLKRPWSDEPIKGGISVKLIPFVFSENLCQLIEQHWDELPMSARDRLTEKALNDEGHQNKCLRETIQRLQEREVLKND